MAVTSAKVTYLTAAGTIEVIGADADIFGYGTLAQRPATGTTVGDCYIVADAGLSIYRIDYWDGAAWQALGGAGISTIPTGNSIWVDAVNGNDLTGVSGRQDLPFATIFSAISAAASGDVVFVRPGTYTEQPITIPAVVGLVSTGGWQETTILGAVATGTRITLSAGSIIDGFTVEAPSNAGAYAVEFPGATGVASANNVTFIGQTGGAGSCLANTGAGKIISAEARWKGPGDIDAVIVATAGIMALESLHVPGGPGSIQAAVKLSGGARGQIIDANSGGPQVVNGFHVFDAILVAVGVNIFNCQNAIRVSDNTADVRLTNGLFEAATNNILVDPGLTGAGGVFRAQLQMEPKFSIPTTWIDSDHAWTFFTKSDLATDASLQLWGADYVVGHPEKGSGSSSGEGTAYSQENTVLTTDATAGPSSNGGGFIDVSVQAESKGGSSFGFQGNAAGHSILWCTNRLDGAGNPLKHFGLEVDQIAAMVAGTGIIVFEIQTAVNTWARQTFMSVSKEQQYNYADQVFLRANSVETIRIGIDSNTVWPATTINGTTGHWMRWRIDLAVTTAPTFERLRLTPSYSYFNDKGQQTTHGLAQWRAELFGTGNTWGEVSGAVNATVAVGAGGAPTGWNQRLIRARMNSNGDSISFQFQIPPGLCSAYGMFFNLYYSTSGGSPITVPVDMILSVLFLATGGVDIADPAGGIVPIARPAIDAEAFTSKAATPQTLSGSTGAITETQQLLRFGPFSFAEYYQGDAVILRIEMDNDGTPNQDVIVWALTVDAVQYTSGNRL